MIRTVEAIIEPNGQVRLSEPVQLPSSRRALLTILDEAPVVQEAALLNEAALAKEWNRAEENGAWAPLKPTTA
jgi:hypothetical protein